MKINPSKEKLIDDQISDHDLENTIKRNQDLFDKLNKLPEIEAIKDIAIDEKSKEYKKAKESSLIIFIDKLSSAYGKNDLFRYAVWSIILMLISTTALTVVEYEMFYASVSEDIEGGFKFGDQTELDRYIFSYFLVGGCYIYNCRIW